ncbi:CobW family GTP-binding protein [Variovorax sp.]|uniref:CobW family GTP-binding protein n=1 Tax=Variovorax sp. TaxID=1871043 RepID=UPI002D5ACD54|nr:CobW family GTP-binding protein [Variovorax sp.]HYP85463.1 CobW family GTP-binding protein [Variovorax sp.]
MQPAPRIPLTVIGGFLGAGKTTLVNRLLADARGRRLAVLVNDFGAVNIDAALVAQSAGDTIALTNGCVCCSIGGDLSAALIRVLAMQPAFDGIVVEASGVSDPARIAQIALADPQLEPNGTLVLVDATVAAGQSRDPLLGEQMATQVKGADFLVVNKTDIATAEDLRALRDWLDSAAPGVPRFETHHAAVPEALLRAPAAAAPACGADCAHETHEAGHAHVHAHMHAHAHDHGHTFETWLGRPPGPLDADVLRTALRDMPAGVLRLKGVVRTDAHGWSEIQFAGRHGSLRRALAPPPGGQASLVAIGLAGRLPRNALDDLLRRSAGHAACEMR